jgi:alkylation response protein AidB-like acyl-CoA dehydrogenase
MAWDFEAEPEYQSKLDWADAFVREEVEPLDVLFGGLESTPPDDRLRRILDPLKAEVRRQKLWATHLGPELGGEGHGQRRLSLLNEILGRSSWAPIVFGCQAPDTGNAEILARYETPDMHGMPARAEILAHYAVVSGRQVDVLAKWKLGVVLERGYQRAGDDEKLQAFGPIVLDLVQGAAELAETSDYGR